jgi:hypothetical protein
MTGRNITVISLLFSVHMEVVVRSRGLPADRVIAIRNGFLSLYREYPNGRIEVAVAVPICKGAEDDLIDKAAQAFRRFDEVWEELLKKADDAVEKGCVS